ncbi:MAG: hypothetical protein WAU77_02250 [Solirubrobacteraceae bacterium]
MAPATVASAQAASLGIAAFAMQTTEADQEDAFLNEPYQFTQSAGHPSALTTTIDFTTKAGPNNTPVPTRDPKDVIIDLPPGLVANPQAVPSCTTPTEQCPAETQVGIFVLRFVSNGKQTAILGPIYNLTTEGSQAAKFGFETPLGLLPLDGHIVHTTQGYTVALVANDLPPYGITSIQATFWGTPAAGVHDTQRGLSCTTNDSSPESSCQTGEGTPSEAEPIPFLTMPDDCSAAAQSATVSADSWEEPEEFTQAQSALPAVTSCDRLPFSPEIGARPDTLLANEPVGIDLSLRVPQIDYPFAEVATPELRNATVTLPTGVSINPGAAGQIQACQSGSEGIDVPSDLNSLGNVTKPGEAGDGEELSPTGEPQLAPGRCPSSSIIGAAEAHTPLLPYPIAGRVYLAYPECGSPGQGSCTEQDAASGKLYRMYIELGGLGAKGTAAEHIVIKLEGRVLANPATGQLTFELPENPQIPLNELNINLFGGPGALLANPSTCGTATTTSELQPWSAAGTPTAHPSAFYTVVGCTNPIPFHPLLVSGTDFPVAGAFSPLTINVTRNNQEQYISAIQLSTPPGLSAALSTVTPCQEPAASYGECSEASRIGDSILASGSGSEPLYLKGNIYLTTGYGGSPFGLSIVTTAVAGPLNLGRVITRAKVYIDPLTAQLTIVSEPLPQIVLGVPLRIQKLILDIDRPDFIFNPTTCAPQQITAAISAAQGADATLSNHFEVGECYGLAFKPRLTVTTSAHTSYAEGASLDILLASPDTGHGAEANLAKIKLVLPKQLPSRLTTLQSACPQKTFEANPATCPRASVVGSASAHTPVLAGELTGPVYFVSQGSKAFPSPVVVLQGDGVILDLVGATSIEKTGFAAIAFATLPDVPVDSLELSLPQGPHSVLSANASLCELRKTVVTKHDVVGRVHGRVVRRQVEARKQVRASLLMPTELVAQNGAVIHQNTKVAVKGCMASKTKPANKAPSARPSRRSG